ncbi:MBL fold metallo-hydrolase [Bacillaceae bacterium W0354]
MNNNIHSLSLGLLGTNCYILEKEKQALIIDPGGDYDDLKEYLNNNQLNPIAILLTHAHFDHIGAVEQLRTEYRIEVYMHEQEKEWLINPELNGSSRFMVGQISAEKMPEHIIDEGPLNIGPFEFNVLHTPGHSPGSLSFYFPKDALIIAGDTLFERSIGRTDLPFGNHEQLILSIKKKLFTLPQETKVYPGHGPATTIEAERRFNPFLV